MLQFLNELWYSLVRLSSKLGAWRMLAEATGQKIVDLSFAVVIAQCVPRRNFLYLFARLDNQSRLVP